MSIEQVRREFDIPRLEAFGRYSEKYPPVHIQIAGIITGLTGKGNAPAPSSQNQDEALTELMQLFPQT